MKPDIKQLQITYGLSLEKIPRQQRTVEALGELAIKLIAYEQEHQISPADYANSYWNYNELYNFALKNDVSSATVGQVFHQWHKLISKDLDILPVDQDLAKRANFDLPLLGALLLSGSVNTPVTKEVLTDFHSHKLEQLTRQA